MAFVPLGEWAPDETDAKVSTLSYVDNVIPDMDHYDPVPAFEVMSDRLMEPLRPLEGEAQTIGDIRGSFSFTKVDGTVETFVGTKKGLYRLVGFSWDDISKEGGYDTGDNYWQFAMYGYYLLATNFNDPVQCVDIRDQDLQFADMSETAPRAKSIAVVNEFVVLLNTYDTLDGERPGRVWWSPIADPRGTWEVNQTTLCDYQDLPAGVTGIRIIGGEAGKIFMRHAIINMTFVGSPLAFQFDTIDPARGCVGINALSHIGDQIYFLSDDGFYAMNGTTAQQIGLHKVDSYVLERYSGGQLAYTQSGVDWQHKCIWWALSSPDYTDPSLSADESLIYHYPSGRWGRCSQPFHAIAQFYTRGYTLDELDNYPNDTGVYPNELEKLPFPLDSVIYKQGNPVFGAFDNEGRLLYSKGPNTLPSTVVTGDSPYGDHTERVWLRRVRIVHDGENKHTVQYLTKQSLDEDPRPDVKKFSTITFNPPVPISRTRAGDYAMRANGRYIRLRFNLSGAWSKLTGYDLTMDKEGTL